MSASPRYNEQESFNQRFRVAFGSSASNLSTVVHVDRGYFDGAPLTAAEVNKLADLESREVLLAKLAGAMKASLTKAAYVFNALPSKAVRTVDALREKQESAA